MFYFNVGQIVGYFTLAVLTYLRYFGTIDTSLEAIILLSFGAGALISVGIIVIDIFWEKLTLIGQSILPFMAMICPIATLSLVLLNLITLNTPGNRLSDLQAAVLIYGPVVLPIITHAVIAYRLRDNLIVGCMFGVAILQALLAILGWIAAPYAPSVEVARAGINNSYMAAGLIAAVIAWRMPSFVKEWLNDF